jgi:hypothetical protein
MKYIKLLILGISIFYLSSCNDYTDHKLILNKIDRIDLFDSFAIEVGVQGRDELTYNVEIIYKEMIIASDTLTSSFKPSTYDVVLNLSMLKDKALDVAFGLVENESLEFGLVLSNESHKILIDTTFRIDFHLPPISQIITADLSHGTTDLKSSLQTSLLEVKKRNTNLEKLKEHKIAFLNELIKKNQKGIHIQRSLNNLEAVKKNAEIIVKATTDTVFSYTIIGAYPVINHDDTSKIAFEDVIEDFISKDLHSFENDGRWKNIQNNFLIEEKLFSEDSGLIGIYLITINEIGKYTYQQIGAYLSDAVSPVFSNSYYCSEPKNPNYEGILCLDSKDFYGWNPYNVPFTGKAYGDVKFIYVNNTNINFKIGEEIYFKKSLYLDGGYNRVKIKIIDQSGNVTESFIPITVENIKNNEIDIENNINIDNY